MLGHCAHSPNRQLYPQPRSNYEKYMEEIVTTELKAPMSIKDIPKLEELNPAISVNVYTYDDDKEIVLLYVTKHVDRQHHVKLLLAQKCEEDGTILRHYLLMRDMSRLVALRKS